MAGTVKNYLRRSKVVGFNLFKASENLVTQTKKLLAIMNIGQFLDTNGTRLQLLC